MDFAHGAIQWLAADALNSDKVVSGLSFQPKAIRFYWVGLQSAVDAASQAVSQRRGVGFASDGIVQRAVGTISTDAAATSDCGSIAVDNGCVVTVSAAGALDGRLSLQSFNSDGFTLNVDDVAPADITVFWEAWGGADITNVTVGDIAEPAATGTQNYTATGFDASGSDDQVVMLAGVQATSALNTGQATDSGLFVSFATGSGTPQVVVQGNSDDASTAMDTDGSVGNSECVRHVIVGGGGLNARANLSAFGADQFTLNWTARALTNRRSIYMAVKGGLWRAGNVIVSGNVLGATSTVSGLPFTPKGLSTLGRMSLSTIGAVHDRIGLGSGSSTTSRRSMGVFDEDATASSACEINTCIEYDAVLAYPSATGTLQSAHDINAMNADGFQLIVDVAGGTANEFIGYLTFGDAPASGQDINLNQSSETNTAQPLGKSKQKAVSLATSTDTSQPLGRVKSLALGQAVETGTAQTLTPQLGAGGTDVPLNPAAETSSAQSLTPAKAKSIGQPSTTESAQSFTSVKMIALGQALESSEALAITTGAALIINTDVSSVGDLYDEAAWRRHQAFQREKYERKDKLRKKAPTIAPPATSPVRPPPPAVPAESTAAHSPQQVAGARDEHLSAVADAAAERAAQAEDEAVMAAIAAMLLED